MLLNAILSADLKPAIRTLSLGAIEGFPAMPPEKKKFPSML